MRQLFFSSLVLGGLLLANCSGKDSPAPANPIPANSATVMVDGVAFPVVMKNTVAVISAQTGALFVNIGTTDVRGSSVSFQLMEFRKKAEVIQLPSSSGSNILVTGEYLNSPDGQYSTDRCSSNVRSFQVTEFNESARTVSGRFSGTVCSTNGKVKVLSDGAFNLPYTIK